MDKEQEDSFFSSKMLACPLRGHWTSFQLVDEFGDGKPYGGLSYTAVDSVGQAFSGRLNGEGFAKVENHYRGPVVLTMDAPHSRIHKLYARLMDRIHYPLPITELQVRAEQTRFFHEDGFRREHNPAIKDADVFLQVEVRDLVRQGAHLPPVVKRFYEPQSSLLRAMNELGIGPEHPFGIALSPNQHNVLEVRPLRALRPLLSTDDQFCALNLYQLALMATLSYTDFGQDPAKRPVDKVRFAEDPSVGHLFGEALAGFRENWRIDKGQRQRFYPLYEDVPYSKRLEILPFDPTLYASNHPDKGEDQEHPANQHFFDDQEDGGDTQAFICHHDEVILIAVRGTASLKDAIRDVDALQVPFEEGVGKVHKGFYDAFRAIKEFVLRYLDRFHAGQKIIICGHSLGGAIALLLAEALRRRPATNYNILLYTYGAPRTGDADFVQGAAELVHHRMVNNNDPVPGVPARWMDANWKVWVPGLTMTALSGYGLLLFGTGLVRVGGAPYEHHGQQQHFMPVRFGEKDSSAVLWDPACESIEGTACSRILQKWRGDMPMRGNLLAQLIDYQDHMMVASYIPFAWATLRRWQQAQESGRTVVTGHEYHLIDNALTTLKAKLQEYAREMRYDVGPRGATEAQSAVRSALSREQGRLEQTRDRLLTLYARRLTLADVYGNAAQSAEFASSVARWAKHTENQQSEQYASLPPLLDSERRLAAQPLDIDSYV
ncbi:lipase family protein [Pseudomonas sp. C2B4]|uniref:lipase family protein n=1 Tax=Pseudomonas sp. C2B4 TaxID=2735270 RepID=UPI0015861ABC|nr:lipase family protein [Pseudomonas sp. C2B4]NUU34982.1 lipase family protein [Pseudomonas sp. C2B4]